MSQTNGVIRIGRKGIKQFAFGDDGKPFEVDVVVAFQEWCCVHDTFAAEGSEDDPIPTQKMPEYHRAAVAFASGLNYNQEVTVAEALDFIARLREQYDELVDFFQPRRPAKDVSPGTSEGGLRFLVEEGASPSSTS